MNRPCVFISYSTSDRQIALTLAEELRHRGIEIWIDYERIDYGDSIPSSISNGLLNAHVMLLLISKAWCNSSWCKIEYETKIKKEIDSRNISVIPILIDDIDLPPLLSAKRYVDACRGFDVGVLERLCLRIQELASEHTILTLVGSSEQGSKSFLPSYDSSLLFLIISKTLEKFPPRIMTDTDVLEGKTVIDLYRVVNSFIDSFQELVSNIIDTLIELARLEREGLKKSFKGLKRYRRMKRYCESIDQFIRNANRKLVAISGDMRILAESLNAIIDRQTELGQHFRALGQVCFQISVLSEGITIKLGAPADLTHLNEWTKETYDEVVSWPDVMALDRDEATVAELNRLLDDLLEYKQRLQSAIARSIAASSGK